MYQISKLTGKEYFNGIEIPKDDTNQLFIDRCEFLTNGGVFEEIEATTEEITQTKTNELLNELVETCIYLTDRALISSVNKEGGEKYLQGQIQRYKEKYVVAMQYLLDGSISNQEWYDAIVLEMNNTNAVFGYGLTIPVFMGIIVEQYDLGQLRSKKFETKIEVFRCKTKDLILTGEFTRARASLDLAKSIPMQLSLEDLELFSNQLGAI